MYVKTGNMQFKMAFSLKNPVWKHGVLHCRVMKGVGFEVWGDGEDVQKYQRDSKVI